MVCYSVDSKSSFENVRTKWVPEIQSHVPKAPFVLVGTKTDLRNDEALQLKDGRNMAKRLGALLYMECSAQTGDGISTFIETALRAVLPSKTGGIKAKLTKMLKIYKRPQDDSSDEESDDEQNISETDGQSLSTSPCTSANVQTKTEDNNVLQKCDQTPMCSVTSINLSVFDDKAMNCESGRAVGIIHEDSVGGGILSRCSSLRRLIEGLKCYDAMKKDPDSFLDFIANQYRIKMIDDFNHFVAEHEHQSNAIVNEMIALHHFKLCDVEHCGHAKRHFDETQRIRLYTSKHSQIGGGDSSNSKLILFYSSKYDALHFVLFHLFETGYRYRVSKPPKKEDDDNNNDDERVAQQELAAAVSAINAGRDRCRGALGRFESESNNKFNLSVGGGTESKMEDGHSVKTTTDSMMEYAASNGVGHDALVQINGFMVREDIDTDAAKDDVADSKEESNFFAITKNHDAFHAVKRYFTLSAGKHSVHNVLFFDLTVFVVVVNDYANSVFCTQPVCSASDFAFFIGNGSIQRKWTEKRRNHGILEITMITRDIRVTSYLWKRLNIEI